MASDTIKLCTECAVTIVPSMASMRLPFLILPKNTMWQSGQTLHVYFMDGSDFVKHKVMEFAKEWCVHANIDFDVVSNHDAEIRISFKAGPGSASYVGTDNLKIPKQRPTMTYGWFNDATPDDEFSRVVLHEFGHALGCVHEHQSPAGKIPWNKEKVYEYYAAPPINWSRKKVDDEIFKKYNKGSSNFTRFDKESIMLYAVPNSLTNGHWHTDWNTVLSKSDKNFISKQYPF